MYTKHKTHILSISENVKINVPVRYWISDYEERLYARFVLTRSLGYITSIQIVVNTLHEPYNYIHVCEFETPIDKPENYLTNWWWEGYPPRIELNEYLMDQLYRKTRDDSYYTYGVLRKSDVGLASVLHEKVVQHFIENNEMTYSIERSMGRI